jgi:hypothetical protein
LGFSNQLSSSDELDQRPARVNYVPRWLLCQADAGNEGSGPAAETLPWSWRSLFLSQVCAHLPDFR